MDNINISDWDSVDSEVFSELSPEELECITGGGWFGRIVGGVVGAGLGVAAGWPNPVTMVGGGIIGAGVGAGLGDGIEESIS